MQKLIGLVILGTAMIISACAHGSQSVNAPINPGDRVGDFVFSTGDAKIAGLPHNYSCNESEDAIDCTTTVGTRVNISPSYYDDTYTGRIDQLWKESTHIMLIEGRPLNLEAFGYLDVPNPAVKSVRKWNVAMVTSKPGVIIIQHSIVFEGEPIKFTATWNFTQP